MGRISTDRATARAARFAAGLRCVCEILPLLGESLRLMESDIETCRAASRGVEAALEQGDAKTIAAALARADEQTRATLAEIGSRDTIDRSHLQSLRSLLALDTSTGYKRRQSSRGAPRTQRFDSQPIVVHPR